MYPRNFFVVVFICLLPASGLLAQRSNPVRTKSPYTRDRHNFRAPVVGHHKAKTICPIFENSKYPYQGIGFKVGDPFALSYKLYPNKHFAFVADVGKPASGLYSKLFREELTRKADELLPNVDAVEYISHKVKSDWVIDIKGLYHMDADKLAKGLQFYTGIGWEYRKSAIEYIYLFETGAQENEFGRLRNNRTTQGVQAVVGIEYAYFQIPISAFIEMEYFIDVVQQPGWRQQQGGIGLRFVF